MLHDQKVKVCFAEATSIEEGLLNMYLAFEAAEGSATPTWSVLAPGMALSEAVCHYNPFLVLSLFATSLENLVDTPCYVLLHVFTLMQP